MRSATKTRTHSAASLPSTGTHLPHQQRRRSNVMACPAVEFGCRVWRTLDAHTLPRTRRSDGGVVRRSGAPARALCFASNCQPGAARHGAAVSRRRPQRLKSRYRSLVQIDKRHWLDLYSPLLDTKLAYLHAWQRTAVRTSFGQAFRQRAFFSLFNRPRPTRR